VKCKCGCLREVRPGNQYASQGCRQRFHSGAQINLGPMPYRHKPKFPSTSLEGGRDAKCPLCSASGSVFRDTHFWTDSLGVMKEGCPKQG
jgi:hypothetical protein